MKFNFCALSRKIARRKMDIMSLSVHVTSCRQLPVTSHRSITPSSSDQRRFLLIVTMTLLIMMTVPLSSPVQSAVILPPHMLLKSDSSNVVDGARSTSGGSRQSKTGLGSSSMRPSPSDNLPVLPLPPFNSKDTLPTKADRDHRALKAKIGSDFDASFMSVKRPSESYRHPNGTYVYDNAVIKTMAASIRLGGFKLPGQRSKLVQIKSKRKRRLLQNYLAALTYCPVHYKWIDLGQRFWPRWIRQGDCSGNEKGVRSCSFPSGMSCKPQRSTSKTVLWWHCESRGQCQWISIKYPVITTCKCSC